MFRGSIAPVPWLCCQRPDRRFRGLLEVSANSSFRLLPSKISIARSSPSVTGVGSGRSSTNRRTEPIGSVSSMIDRPILVAPVSAPDGSRTGRRAWLARAAGEPLDLHFTWHVRVPRCRRPTQRGMTAGNAGNVSPPALARSPSRSGIGAALPDDTPRLPRDRDAVKRDVAKTLYN